MMHQPEILVVDDNHIDRVFIATALQQAGYKIDIALSGQHALAKVMKSYPQCLILNVFLLDTTGYAICRQIRQHIPKDKVSIILTGPQGAALDQSYGLSQGAQRYLLKPFTAELLIQSVQEVIPKAFLPSPPPPPQHPALLECIPRRVSDQNEMRSSNPFLYSALKSGQARQLYSAINGKRTVSDLAAITGLNTKEISGTLRVLLEEHYIQLYDPTGQLVSDDQLS